MFTRKKNELIAKHGNRTIEKIFFSFLLKCIFINIYFLQLQKNLANIHKISNLLTVEKRNKTDLKFNHNHLGIPTFENF